MINTVYLDLDGVLYDLLKSLALFDGYDVVAEWLELINNSPMTFQQYISEAMLKYRMNSLFSKGDILPDGERLIIDLIEYKKNMILNL